MQFPNVLPVDLVFIKSNNSSFCCHNLCTDLRFIQGALVGMAVGFGFALTLSIGSNDVNPYRTHLNTTVTECAVNVTAIQENP